MEEAAEAAESQSSSQEGNIEAGGGSKVRNVRKRKKDREGQEDGPKVAWTLLGITQPRPHLFNDP